MHKPIYDSKVLSGKTIKEVSEPFSGTLRLVMTDGTVFDIEGGYNEDYGFDEITITQNF